MLGKLKKIYKLLPSSISGPIIRKLKLAPVYSQKQWEKVEEISVENDKTINAKKVNRLLQSLTSDLKPSEFYKKSSYKNFLDSPSISTLKELPIIDSSIVRKNFEAIINENIPGYYTSTGGTGGTPLKLYLSDESYFIDRAYVFYAWSILGYCNGDKKLTLRGVNLGQKLTEYNPMNNELNVNVFLLNEKNIDQVVKEINKFEPDFGHGYPSVWFNFSTLLRNHNYNLQKPLKGIYYASETVDNEKRNRVEEFFNVKVRSTYSSSERSYFAYELAWEKNVYKIMHRYGLIEVLNEDGENTNVGELGEIVCTGFINAALPLLRYRTGDFATVHKKREGIVTEIKDIQGRWGKDFILDKEDNKVFTTSINIHSKAQYKFKYIQLYQKNKGLLEIRLVPFDNKSSHLANSIRKEFEEKLPMVEVSIKVLDNEGLYRTHRGKVPYLIKEE